MIHFTYEEIDAKVWIVQRPWHHSGNLVQPLGETTWDPSLTNATKQVCLRDHLLFLAWSTPPTPSCLYSVRSNKEFLNHTLLLASFNPPKAHPLNVHSIINNSMVLLTKTPACHVLSNFAFYAVLKLHLQRLDEESSCACFSVSHYSLLPQISSPIKAPPGTPLTTLLAFLIPT